MKSKAVFNTSDEQLVHQYLNGNRDALGTLYQRYYPKVYQKCLSFSRNHDDAFDLAQDILMKAFSKISMFKGKSKFSTWLYAITQNYCISSTAKAKSCQFDDFLIEPETMDETIVSDEFELRKEFEERELNLQNILDNIPISDRIILDLKYKKNYSVKDLQTELNLSASAVKMRLMRARQKVEQYYYQTAI